MSILIKNMEMPQNCRDCLMSSFGLCNLIEGVPIGNPQKRLDNCPLIELPPHGRLIDADALCKTLRSLAENEYTPEVFANWIENHIDTIVPKEGGET